MDLLGNLSRENLTTGIWVFVLIFAVAMGVWRRRQLQWVALSSVMLFAVLNAGVGIYVLNTIGDARWAREGAVPLSAPSLAEAPIVGQYLDPLDSALQSIVGGVNSYLAFQQALPVALTFFANSGWALLIAVPILIIVAIMGYRAVNRRKKELASYRHKVDQLQIDLERIKDQLVTLDVPQTDHRSTVVLPQAMRRDH